MPLQKFTIGRKSLAKLLKYKEFIARRGFGRRRANNSNMKPQKNDPWRRVRFIVLSLLLSGGLWAQTQSGSASANGQSSSGQSSSSQQPAGSGWEQQFFWMEGLQFSSNHYGRIWVLNNAAGFHLTKRLSLEVGLPFYNVNSSQGNVSGLGDVYAQLELLTALPAARLTTSLTVTAPTGNKSAGLSSGRPTVDFTNGLAHRWSMIGLFGNAGVADTIANSAYFVRPVSSYGWVGHFEAGGELFPNGHIGVGAAAYDILPFGSQTIYQRGNGNGNVLGSLMGGSGSGMGGGLLGGGMGHSGAKATGSSGLDRDNGGAAWVDISPIRSINIELSYSRSVHFDLNTFAVSINSNIWSLIHSH